MRTLKTYNITVKYLDNTAATFDIQAMNEQVAKQKLDKQMRKNKKDYIVKSCVEATPITQPKATNTDNTLQQTVTDSI